MAERRQLGFAMSGWKPFAKGLLGHLPYAAEAYQRWWAAGESPPGGYGLDRLSERLPSWVEAVAAARAEGAPDPRTDSKRVLVFGCLQWWLEHAAALALLLRADGRRVDLAFLPQRRWHSDPPQFDLRRQQAYLQHTLAPLGAEIGLIPLRPAGKQPSTELSEAMEQQSRLDVQYTLQREQIDWQGDREASELLSLRRARNSDLARAAYRLLRRTRYDSIVIPNGSILEFGALYRVASHLGQQSITYEFGERRQHLWLAQGAAVMRLPTEALWRRRAALPLTTEQRERLERLLSARRSGQSWDHFGRKWQRGRSAGAQAAAERLGLAPDRPIVLLCTNVVGDSLALDRQIFTRGMSDWLAETVRLLSGRNGLQVVVRVHPGEMLGAGHPSVDLVRSALPELPEQIVVIPPESEVNTYDLIELAQLGLVYTTTVGLEMAMHGVPVVVAGDTHYAGKGFTHDPQTAAEYRERLDQLLAEAPIRPLLPQQVELAWRYAYRFFFEYPFPFPWHLLHFWNDLEDRPLEQVVRAAGRRQYAGTLRALAGEPIDWEKGTAGEGTAEAVARSQPERVGG